MNCTPGVSTTMSLTDCLPHGKNFTNVTTGEEEEEKRISMVLILTCAILFFIVFLTLAGNLVVILAFVFDRRLTANTHFNYYIINLALTDLLVAVMAMSFYTFDVLLGYWPFGEFMCGVWIFFDYGMTFASVFTLVAISADRYWSVAWYLHYRNHNSKKKTFTAIGIVWLCVLAVWLGPCIVDRIRWSEPGFCKWEPSKNQAFVVFIAIIGHHTPCIVMVFCYVRVAYAMLSRRDIKKSKRVGPTVTSSSSTEGESTVTEDAGSTATATATSAAAAQKAAPAKPKAGDDKEKKIFVTLSYVILSYLACWVPFHVVFDISAIDPTWVPEPIYTATFWLTYFNSTLNPFLYAYSSKEFRNAFKMVIKCQCFSASRSSA